MFKIEKVDNGRCILIYKTLNSQGQAIFYGFQEGIKELEFFRCSQPFKEYGEEIFEAQSKATIKGPIQMEVPRGSSKLEQRVKSLIEDHPLINKL